MYLLDIAEVTYPYYLSIADSDCSFRFPIPVSGFYILGLPKFKLIFKRERKLSTVYISNTRISLRINVTLTFSSFKSSNITKLSNTTRLLISRAWGQGTALSNNNNK